MLKNNKFLLIFNPASGKKRAIYDKGSIINYLETYVITEEGFTWTVTSNVSEGPYTEEGTYTISTTDTTTIYTLMGTSKHGIEGYREGYIGEVENIMTIKVQKDSESDHIIDKCFNFTFDKIN